MEKYVKFYVNLKSRVKVFDTNGEMELLSYNIIMNYSLLPIQLKL